MQLSFRLLLQGQTKKDRDVLSKAQKMRIQLKWCRITDSVETEAY